MTGNIENYPPLVHNPALGRHVLLRWCHWDHGNHVIISDDIQGLLSSWKHSLDKYGHKTIPVQYVEANLVSCPPEVAADWAMNQYLVEFDRFRQWLMGMAYSVYDSTGVLPEIFIHCPHPEDDSRWECAKCEGLQVRIPEPILESLFQNRDIKAMYENRMGKTQKAPTGSVKPLANPELPLRVTTLDEGHHQNGIVFMPLDEWTGTTPESIRYCRLPVLFFFQGVDAAIPQEILDMRQTAVAKHAQQQKERQDAVEDNCRKQIQEDQMLLKRIAETYKPA